LHGAIVSHNHPIDETEFSFSGDDIDLFDKYNLKSLRGCDKKYTYELSRNSNEIDDHKDLEPTFENNRHYMVIMEAKSMNVGYRRWKND
jgi:hypothetical protein